MKVPFLSLSSAYNEIAAEIDEAIQSVVSSSTFIGGETLSEFEENFAKYNQAKYCVGVANGFDALKLALKALGTSSGDEVIVPSNTFIATWLAVTHCGATPVPVEPNENNYSIDVARIERAITSKTKAIIPVHLFGHPADMNSILEISKKYNLYVVEDAAQAHGAKYCDKKIGAHGDVVAWSFYPGKNLGAFGDGGAVTTDNEMISDRIRTLGNYGSKEKYKNDLMGINSRLDPLQANILNVKLKYLDVWNQRRRDIARKYIREISLEGLILPTSIDLDNSSWHLFPVRHIQRDNIMSKLNELGIQTLIHYPIPPHKQNAYKKYFSQHNLYISEMISNQIFSLPIGPHMSFQETEYVIKSINTLLNN